MGPVRCTFWSPTKYRQRAAIRPLSGCPFNLCTKILTKANTSLLGGHLVQPKSPLQMHKLYPASGGCPYRTMVQSSVRSRMVLNYFALSPLQDAANFKFSPGRRLIEVVRCGKLYPLLQPNGARLRLDLFCKPPTAPSRPGHQKQWQSQPKSVFGPLALRRG